MNRWWGSQSDSIAQSADRDSRAARRTIARQQTINSDSDENDFADCNTSFNRSLNLDGEPGESADLTMNANEQAARAALAAEKAKPVEDADYADDEDAWKKEVKLKFDQSDVKYWFNSVESTMKKYGINSQWSKKDAIA